MLTSQASALVATNSIFAVLAISAVILRICIRKQQSAVLQYDDHFILVALFFSIALVITNLVGVAVGGLGAPFPSLGEETGIVFLKILFVMQFWYIIAVGVVKISILCLYGRLFSAHKYPIMIKFMLCITTAWALSFLLATFFQVWALWCNWTHCADPASRSDYPVTYVCSSATDIVLDVTILCLPVSFIRRLQTNVGQKIGMTSIFGLGIFCTVASITRLVYTVQMVEDIATQGFASNFGSSVVNMIMWSGIEACASVICACLPCYAPLITANPTLKSLVARFKRRPSWHTISTSHSGSKLPFRPFRAWWRVDSASEPLNPLSSRVVTTIVGGNPVIAREPQLGLGQIGVKSSIEVRRPMNSGGVRYSLG
ncbi:hypothetical protein ACLMJK_001469 [Lecanora helva]